LKNIAPVRPSRPFTLMRILLTLILISLVLVNAPLPYIHAETTSAFSSPVESWIADAKDEVWGEYPTVQDPWPVHETVRDLKGLDLPSRSNPSQTIEPEITEQKIATKPVNPEPPVATPTPALEPLVATPTPVPEPAKPAAPPSDWLSEFVRLTNAAREKNGLAPLSLHGTLCQAADIRAAELAVSPSPHLRPDGDAFYTVLSDVNLTASYCGENYAIDPSQAATAEQIVNAWMNSPTHRKNILNSNYTGIAFSTAVVNGTVYYEQLFIG